MHDGRVRDQRSGGATHQEMRCALVHAEVIPLPYLLTTPLIPSRVSKRCTPECEQTDVTPTITSFPESQSIASQRSHCFMISTFCHSMNCIAFVFALCLHLHSTALRFTARTNSFRVSSVEVTHISTCFRRFAQEFVCFWSLIFYFSDFGRGYGVRGLDCV